MSGSYPKSDPVTGETYFARKARERREKLIAEGKCIWCKTLLPLFTMSLLDPRDNPQIYPHTRCLDCIEADNARRRK